MLFVIACMFSGIAVGWLLRRRSLRWVPAVVTLLIWMLLLLLGAEVGQNQHIIGALGTLGAEALLFAAAATLGSCLLAWALWRWSKGNKRGQQ